MIAWVHWWRPRPQARKRLMLATRRRIHPAYAALLLAILIVSPVVLQLSGKYMWHAVAAWMTR